MKRKLMTTLLLAVTAVSLLGGCGEARETGGNARREEKEESGGQPRGM